MKLSSQDNKVLYYLQMMGDQGFTNVEFLGKKIQRYSACIKRLRDSGFYIVTTRVTRHICLFSLGKPKIDKGLLEYLYGLDTKRKRYLKRQRLIWKVFDILSDGKWHQNIKLTEDIGNLRLGPVIQQLRSYGHRIDVEKISNRHGSHRYRLVS
ncbi:hypothetical protein KKC60_03330 [Patescibacteria group bacterium]|nr:hypothetical protein [Patescibacteria group bacterium]